MTRTFFSLAVLLTLALLLPACGDGKPAGTTGSGDAPTQGAHPDEGKVLEKIDVETYTYIRTVRLGKEIWVSAPKFQVEVGDSVIVPEGMPQRNFRSETLNRTFDLLYMVSGVQVVGADAPMGGMPGGMNPGAMPEGHPPVPGMTPPAQDPGTPEEHMKAGPVKIDVNVAKAEGGVTVEEVFKNSKDLKDKDLILRGKVVKFNAQIMGKNWIHIQDGSGEKGTNDLTITTMGTAKVGDTVLVKGKLSLDKDFGFGYKYALIVEDAEVTVEK